MFFLENYDLKFVYNLYERQSSKGSKCNTRLIQRPSGTKRMVTTSQNFHYLQMLGHHSKGAYDVRTHTCNRAGRKNKKNNKKPNTPTPTAKEEWDLCVCFYCFSITRESIKNYNLSTNIYANQAVRHQRSIGSFVPPTPVYIKPIML